MGRADARDKNISFVQGDAGARPFDDESFDIVLSLNGFHAFPDKEAARRETYRVLKKGGDCCDFDFVRHDTDAGDGCKRTDWFIKKLYVPKGFSTPPFETEDSLRKRLTGMYEEVSVSSAEGTDCFRCR